MHLWVLRIYRRIRVRKLLALGLLVSLVLTSIFGNAICFYIFDGGSDSNITFGDAVWLSIISVTTIGYGDLSASSLGARLGTLFFIVLLGLSTFTIFMGMVIEWITEFSHRGKRGMASIDTENHILLVNFPGTGRVRQIIEELLSDPTHRKQNVVIVTDQIETLPFTYRDVLFISGSPLEMETYERARAATAKMALVLATSYSDPNSDAVVASAVSVIDRINPDIHIVAECLDEKHRMLFESVRCNAIVPGLRIIGNLLVQEVNDPGISQLIDVITSNLKGATLFSSRVSAEPPSRGGYSDVAKRLIDQGVNLLCIHRGEQTHTTFTDITPQEGDTLIYIHDQRLPWEKLLQLAGGA